jgi:PAS domain S-box-containing protein
VTHMRATAVRPTGVERTFRDDQIIVSKTDPKGRLTYVNDMFVQISGYDEAELIGQPHSMIRHPDMPRAIFKLLWDTISAGEELFAYVMNLSADGSHYWVLAHVTPTFDAERRIVGYHSSRRTASRQALDQIQPLYRALLTEERRHDHTPTAVASSYALLEQTLKDRGLSYPEWVWTLDTEHEEVAA